MLTNPNFLVPAAVFVVGLVIMLVGTYCVRRRRRKGLEALAERLGVTFEPTFDDKPGAEYKRFEAFLDGDFPSALNTMRGSLEILGESRAVRMGDFKYMVRGASSTNGSRSSWRRLSYIMADMPLEHVPPVRLRPLTRADRIVGVLGKKLTSEGSAKAFDRALLATRPGMKPFMKRFRVEGTDEGFEHPLLTDEMIAFLLRDAPGQVEIVASGCCLSDLGRPWKARAFEANLAWLCEFVERWPERFRSEIGPGR